MLRKAPRSAGAAGPARSSSTVSEAGPTRIAVKPPGTWRRRWKTVRKVWAVLGALAFVLFTVWNLLAYRTWGVRPEVLRSDGSVEVRETERAYEFLARRDAAPVGVVLFPGALVDPRAYAPLARRLAEAGFTTAIVRVPYRGAFSLADAGEVAGRAVRIMEDLPPSRWLVSGHSKGVDFACRFARRHPERTAALLLMGSSHPRELDLSGLSIPVTKIVATRDGLASPERVRRFAHNLPAATRWVRIEGGNHSQFAYYGYQPGDRWARISREEQQAVVTAEFLRLLWDLR